MTNDQTWTDLSLLTLVIGHWSLVIGHWSLVIGHWSLVIGHWSLVIGHWSLVIGHWSLVIGHWSFNPPPLSQRLHSTRVELALKISQHRAQFPRHLHWTKTRIGPKHLPHLRKIIR